MLNRREFSFLLACAAGARLLPSSLMIAQTVDDTSKLSPQAAEIFGRALALDCNSAPPLQDTLPLPQEKLEMARNCGVTVVKTTLGGFNGDFAATVEDIAYIQRLVEYHPDYFLQVRVAADMERAKQEKKMGIIASFEA